MEDMMVEQWNISWWNSGRYDGGTVEERLWNSRTSNGGTVEHMMVKQSNM